MSSNFLPLQILPLWTDRILALRIRLQGTQGSQGARGQDHRVRQRGEGLEEDACRSPLEIEVWLHEEGPKGVGGGSSLKQF